VMIRDNAKRSNQRITVCNSWIEGGDLTSLGPDPRGLTAWPPVLLQQIDVRPSVDLLDVK
jgi:hypothetical protein